jgi:hypothetical protein
MSRIRKRDDSRMDDDDLSKRIRLNEITNDSANETLNTNEKTDCEFICDGGGMSDDTDEKPDRSLISRISETAMNDSCNSEMVLNVQMQPKTAMMVDSEQSQSIVSSIHSSMAARSGDMHPLGADWWSNHYWFMGEDSEVDT